MQNFKHSQPRKQYGCYEIMGIQYMAESAGLCSTGKQSPNSSFSALESVIEKEIEQSDNFQKQRGTEKAIEETRAFLQISAPNSGNYLNQFLCHIQHYGVQVLSLDASSERDKECLAKIRKVIQQCVQKNRDRARRTLLSMLLNTKNGTETIHKGKSGSQPR